MFLTNILVVHVGDPCAVMAFRSIRGSENLHTRHEVRCARVNDTVSVGNQPALTLSRRRWLKVCRWRYYNEEILEKEEGEHGQTKDVKNAILKEERD